MLSEPITLAPELRSSSKEIFFMDKQRGQTDCEKPSPAGHASKAPITFKFDESQAIEQFNQHKRKDSGSSEVAAFLNPSGRTSRISSVGSQGSAMSRLSGASGVPRSPSPHKMLVETSFCGPKPIEPAASDASNIELTSDMLENVILARRGDPTKASFAEGLEIKDETLKSKSKTTKEKQLEEIPIQLTPAEAGRAAARESRKKEIEALKVRLNAINAKQLEKAKTGGTVAGVPSVAKESKSGAAVKKTVIGVTPEGTEYTRIKLKPEHLYEDNGMSPNERIVEESEFKISGGRREKSRKDPLADELLNQIRRVSPSTDNRSSSPAASTSVSRKNSFCSFFKSKEPIIEASSSKPRSSSASSGKGRLNDKSPLPSPKSHDGMTMKPITQQHQSRQPIKADKPKLKYYDTPDVIHIPLHTPPEEKEFNEFKKKKEDEVKVEPKVAPAPKVPPAPPIRHVKVLAKPRVAPIALMEKMQSTVEVELQELPKRKASTAYDREGRSSIWSVEVQRHSSQESQETVVSTQQKDENASKSAKTDKPAVPDFIDTINENPSNAQQPMSAKGRYKKHILFSTKIGSGSQEQIFCTQLSLSKTESQSSQLSEQASVFESPRNEESISKATEVCRNSLKQQSSSEGEKKTSARSRLSDQSDSADSRSHSVTRKQQSSTEIIGKRESSVEALRKHYSSTEFSKKRESSDEASRKHQSSTEFSKKRNSSDEASRKKRDSGEQKLSQSPRSNHSPISPSMASVHSQTSFKKQESQQASSLQYQSSSSKMEISSGSDRESDIYGCIHKSVSRVLEDHESAGLVLQESFDDELPYVPTTLPEERPSGLWIVPTKDRTQNEVINIPVERPRSTTPINPSSLDNYCERKPSDASEILLVRGEKLRISLPKQKAEETKEKVQQKITTSRVSNLSNKSWKDFAEQQQQQPTSSPSTKKKEKNRKQSTSNQNVDLPPPPPPTRSHSKKSLTSKWIDFENIPEKRQVPKKITSIPSSKEQVSEKNHKHGHVHQRHFVSPEECKCECHESLTKKETNINDQSPAEAGKTPSSDESQPFLDDAERKSLMSTDSSLDCSLENDEGNFLIQQSTSNQTNHQNRSVSNNLDKPFGMDLSVGFGGHSNRSSAASQDFKLPNKSSHK